MNLGFFKFGFEIAPLCACLFEFLECDLVAVLQLQVLFPFALEACLDATQFLLQPLDRLDVVSLPLLKRGLDRHQLADLAAFVA